MQDPTFENKRKILELLHTQVTVKDRRIKTTGRIPVCAIAVDDVSRLRQGSRKVSARRSDAEDASIGAHGIAQNARADKNSRAHFSF